MSDAADGDRCPLDLDIEIEGFRGPVNASVGETERDCRRTLSPLGAGSGLAAGEADLDPCPRRGDWRANALSSWTSAAAGSWKGHGVVGSRA